MKMRLLYMLGIAVFHGVYGVGMGIKGPVSGKIVGKA